MLAKKVGWQIKKYSDLWRDFSGDKSDLTDNDIIKGKKMIAYIGFSVKTHKLHARILCRKYKHCAPVIITANQTVIYQFVNTGKIIPIKLRKNDLNRLTNYGWIFIKCNHTPICDDICNIHALTCVQFTKRVYSIKKIFIQTPDALLRYLK